jgi:hypothetical protein
VLAEELERALAVDRVRSVEEFDFGAVAQAQLIVEAADLGVFPGHPLVGGNAVVVAPFDHERARRHEVGQLGVVGDMPHVPLEHFVFGREDVAVLVAVGRVFAHPLVEVAGADRQAIFRQHGRHANRRLAAVRQAVKRNPPGVDVRQRGQPGNRSLVLRNDVAEE